VIFKNTRKATPWTPMAQKTGCEYVKKGGTKEEVRERRATGTRQKA